jgi:hypothetical protein
MRDTEPQPGARLTEGASSAVDGSRRAFVKRAALVGLPVVLATIPSRTVWAKPRPPAGKQGGLPDGGGQLTALSAGGSVNPSGSTAKVNSLF